MKTVTIRVELSFFHYSFIDKYLVIRVEEIGSTSWGFVYEIEFHSFKDAQYFLNCELGGLKVSEVKCK